MNDRTATTTAFTSERDPLASTPYRAIREIGQGAMGMVYEAEHRALRTRLAVKVLRAECAANPVTVDRLRIEAQAAASLSDNPHVVRVSDLGQLPDGTPYVVMEKLEGRSLRDELDARGPLPVAEAVDLARQALAGLAAAHALGIVHRDIKPANLFLCAPARDGRRVLKILDFGIAKVLESADRDRAPKPLALPTQEGTTLGTPRYLPPEQAFGRGVDRRSDLYSVGAVLYRMLTGRDPFSHHKGAFAVMRAHVLEAPAPPSSVAQQPIPAALDAAIIQALAKKPADRFGSAEEFSEALSRALEPSSGATRWLQTERVDVRQLRAEVAKRRDSGTLPLAGLPTTPVAINERGWEADETTVPLLHSTWSRLPRVLLSKRRALVLVVLALTTTLFLMLRRRWAGL